MRHLSGLKQLQHLIIWAQWDEPDEWYYDGNDWSDSHAQPFAAMPGLTRLESNICGLEALVELSSCRNLQHLAICMTRTHSLPVDWASIAVLTQLTQLRLLNASLSEASEKACEAFSKLTRLQVVAAAGWSQDFLPALTACVQLTEISGDWTWMRSSAEHALPQVLVLEGIVMPPDRDVSHCAAQMGLFPSLRHLRADVLVDGSQYQCSSALAPSDLSCLSRHCTGLQKLVLTARHGTLTHDMVDCVAAIRSMTSLQHLACLKFTARTNLELLALVRACCVLEGHSLQELHVFEVGMQLFVDQPAPAAAAWMQLGQLRQLPTLEVCIASKQTHDALAAEATVFLSALFGCRTVLLRLPCLSFEPFENAQAELRRVGWPVQSLNIGSWFLPL